MSADDLPMPRADLPRRRAVEAGARAACKVAGTCNGAGICEDAGQCMIAGQSECTTAAVTAYLRAPGRDVEAQSVENAMKEREG